MANTMLTVFLNPKTCSAYAVNDSLAIAADGQFTAGTTVTTFQLGSSTSRADRLAAADRLLAGVQAWRDQLAASAKAEATAVDQLAAATARIAELEAAAEAAGLLPLPGEDQ